MLYFCATALIMKYARPPRLTISIARQCGAQFMADVTIVAPPELAQQILRTLVERFRQRQTHLDPQIPAPARQRRRTPPRDAHPAAGLGARRDADLQRSVEERQLDPGAERCLVHGNRHREVKIIPLAADVRMRRDADVHVEVAVGTAAPAGVAVTR